LLEHGRPSPFARDAKGKNAMHVAASKVDLDSFEHLIELGADAMQPDPEGNTFLHLLALG
jgi:ankyrin repeat protein